MFFKTFRPYTLIMASALLLSACGDSGVPESRSVSDIEKIVRDYLLKNPEVLAEAQIEFEKNQRKKQETKIISVIKDNAKGLFYSPLSPVGGNKDGDVTIVEFFDYNCPYCRQSSKQLSKFLAGDDKVRVVYKEFPIFGGASRVAAEAALASKKQGKYKEFHYALLGGEKRVTPAAVYKIAKSVGLDVDKLKEDMKSDDVAKELKEVSALASKLGIQGTPAYLVGNNLIPGAPGNLVERMKGHAKSLREKPCKYC